MAEHPFEREGTRDEYDTVITRSDAQKIFENIPTNTAF
jgi:hypothetical protein